LDPHLKKYYIILGVSLAFTVGLQLVLGRLGVPWYISMGLVMAIFILLPMYMRKRQMGNFSGRSSGRGGGFFGMSSPGDSVGVKYVCLVCNNKHKGGTCPRCGSKTQRADF
jgi:hypothetical protein